MKTKIVFFLIIGLSFSIYSFGQGRRDTVTNEIYIIVEKMPKCNISIDELEAKVNDVLVPKDFQIENDVVFYVTFIVDYKGNDFNYKVHRLGNKVFNDKLIGCLKEFTNWTPPVHYGKNVDVSKTIVIKVHDNSFDFIDEKEFRKRMKGKR